jgi:gamma-glutamyltranspeptidase/glutathione hydrolase
VIRGARAEATDPIAAAAAQAVVESGGAAVDAIIAGFFAAAGGDPGVLFAPAIALVGGFGAGGRVYDGRAAQPGRAAPRPRGFVDDRDVPEGARVATPRTIAMLVLLSSYRGRASLAELARHGVLAAEEAGSKPRARLVRQVGAAGVLALRSSEVQQALLAVGGPVAGGTLTADDLEEAAPAEAEARATPLGEGLTIFGSPFEAPSMSDAESIVACDGRGAIAALAYVPAREGIRVPALEVRLGRHAVPVRRGVTRLAPGTVLPASAPIGIAAQAGGAAVAMGFAGRVHLEPDAFAWIPEGTAMEPSLSAQRARLGATAAVAVLTDGKTARAARVASS